MTLISHWDINAGMLALTQSQQNPGLPPVLSLDGSSFSPSGS